MEFIKEHKYNKKWCNGAMVQWHNGIIIQTVMVSLEIVTYILSEKLIFLLKIF